MLCHTSSTAPLHEFWKEQHPSVHRMERRRLPRAGTVWFGLWSTGGIREAGRRGELRAVRLRQACAGVEGSWLEVIWEEQRILVGREWKDVLEPTYERAQPLFMTPCLLSGEGEESSVFSGSCWVGLTGLHALRGDLGLGEDMDEVKEYCRD